MNFQDERPDIKECLWRTINSRNLAPEYDMYMVSISQIYKEGYRQIDELKKTKFGKPLFDLTNQNKIKLLDLDIARILGFGMFLTEYMILPVSCNSSNNIHVNRLGGLANLIVTIFDFFVDSGKLKNYNFISTCLKSESNVKFRMITFINYLRGNCYQKIMIGLILLYFKQLNSLFLKSENGKQKKALLSDIIHEMYLAQIQTIQSEKQVDIKTWENKSALPFVVMGFPIWFTVNNLAPDLSKWHLNWMKKLGSLIGKVDDAVDYHHDRITASPNIFLLFMDENRSFGEPHCQKICDEVANEIELLQREWLEKTNCLHYTPLIKNILMITITSWYGGLPIQFNNNFTCRK